MNFLPRNHSLYETVIVSINDYLVDLFLNKIINFKDISTLFLKLVKLPQFSRYKNIKPKNVEQILKLNEFVRLKIKSLSI